MQNFDILPYFLPFKREIKNLNVHLFINHTLQNNNKKTFK